MNILNVGYTSTNYYILADAKPRLLIDVGFAGTLVKLQHEMKRLDVKLSDIKHLLATHYHPDHAGLAQELQGMGVKLIIVDVQQAALETLKVDDPDFTKHYSPYDRKAAVVITLAESRAFLAKFGIKGEIIATPGHSDDSVTLITDDGAAFTGDLTPPIMAGEGNVETLQKSWDAIRAHGAKTFYPGHGPSHPVR